MHTINLLIIVIVTMTFSSIINASTRIVWKDDINYVEISSQPETINNYPITIKAEILSRILSQLRVIHNPSHSSFNFDTNTDEDSSYIFTSKEINILTQNLRDAFTSVDTNEIVTFTVSDFKSVYFGKKYLSVSGTAFISDQYLNIIFGEINVDLQKKYIRSGSTLSNSRFASNSELSNFKLNTGSITRSGDHDWKLKPFIGAELANQRHDWIRINLAHNFNTSQDITRPESQLDKTHHSNDLKLMNKQNNLVFDSQSNNSQNINYNTITSNSISSLSFEERIRKLKALYNNGFIPESIYLNKLHEIISEL
jgi:hypothetical protein